MKTLTHLSLFSGIGGLDLAAEMAAELWPGYFLAEAEALKNLYNHGTYIHLRMARPETWHGRPPRAEYLWGELGEDEP